MTSGESCSTDRGGAYVIVSSPNREYTRPKLATTSGILYSRSEAPTRTASPRSDTGYAEVTPSQGLVGNRLVCEFNDNGYTHLGDFASSLMANYNMREAAEDFFSRVDGPPDGLDVPLDAFHAPPDALHAPRDAVHAFWDHALPSADAENYKLHPTQRNNLHPTQRTNHHSSNSLPTSSLTRTSSLNRAAAASNFALQSSTYARNTYGEGEANKRQMRALDTDLDTSSAGTNTRGTASTSSIHKKTQYHKTKLCPWHKEGKCFMGEVCNYAHTREELKPKPDLSKTKLCPEIVKNKHCDRPGCRFAHDFVELRATSTFFKTRLCKFWQRGYCPAGPECRHAHGKEDLRMDAVEDDVKVESQYASHWPGQKGPSSPSFMSTNAASPVLGAGASMEGLTPLFLQCAEALIEASTDSAFFNRSSYEESSACVQQGEECLLPQGLLDSSPDPH